MTINSVQKYMTQDDILSYIRSTYLHPITAIKASGVSKQWKHIFDCKTVWKNIGSIVAQRLLIPEENILPAEDLPLDKYKAYILTYVHIAYTSRIKQALSSAFPKVQIPKELSPFDPCFMAPYIQHIQSITQSSPNLITLATAPFQHYHALASLNDHINKYVFLKDKQFDPLVFTLVIQSIEKNMQLVEKDLIYSRLLGELSIKDRLSDCFTIAKIIKGHSKTFPNSMFCLNVYHLALVYVLHYYEQLPKNENISKNKQVLDQAVDLLKEIIDDSELINQFVALTQKFNLNCLSVEFRDTIRSKIDECKRILQQIAEQKL